MLSTRGKEWMRVSYLHGKEDLYHEKDNPNGIVWFTNAENWFMRDDMMDFISSHVREPLLELLIVYTKSQFGKHCCTYGEGYTGTLRLRTAMANHLNIHFRPVQAIDPEDVTFSAGVTDLNEACSLVTCNPGDAIMLGRPVYGPFGKDLALRTGVKLEWVDVGDTDQFSPACAAAYEAEFEKAKARGSNIKALIITNPHNPLGQCYPRETLLALLRFCAAKKIHLISDEIYALSVYDRNDRPSEKFTSVLSIDISDVIDPRYVHVLYGMSKASPQSLSLCITPALTL
ncbi:classes I and II family protein [Rutstroemia sp. NJR-2017a WRK4]|nr:classes I and II family protein [Rutstroemia sp. NJR-2017a WRK4]